MNLTGKPSVDKPWLQFYPEQLRNVEVPKMTIEEFLKFKNQDENRIAFEYYGNKITWKTLWKEVDKAARSLKVPEAFAIQRCRREHMEAAIQSVLADVVHILKCSTTQ